MPKNGLAIARQLRGNAADSPRWKRMTESATAAIFIGQGLRLAPAERRWPMRQAAPAAFGVTEARVGRGAAQGTPRSNGHGATNHHHQGVGSPTTTRRPSRVKDPS